MRLDPVPAFALACVLAACGSPTPAAAPATAGPATAKSSPATPVADPLRHCAAALQIVDELGACSEADTVTPDKRAIMLEFYQRLSTGPVELTRESDAICAAAALSPACLAQRWLSLT